MHSRGSMATQGKSKHSSVKALPLALELYQNVKRLRP